MGRIHVAGAARRYRILVHAVPMGRVQRRCVREQVVVHRLAPGFRIGRIVVVEDVVGEYVVAVLGPHVHTHPGTHGKHVVVAGSVVTFAPLETAGQEDVVRDLVVGRAVVQVHVPALVAPPAVVPHEDRLHGVENLETGRGGHPGVDRADVGIPVAIAAPTVEGAMVAGLEHGVEDVVVLDDMPAPAPVANVDTSPRHVVDAVVADGDFRRHVEPDTGHLLLRIADVVNQVVRDRALGGIIVGLGAGGLVQAADHT